MIMLRKFLILITTLLSACCLICNNFAFAYENSIKAAVDKFDGTSLVEQGIVNLKNNISNYRFCYAYDYDGDGLQEAYAISGVWEEGIVDGKLWFIDSDGTYDIVKEGLYCVADLFEPELVYAGKQIFVIFNQTQNDRVISLICGCRNGEPYFPAISEQVTSFHSEGEHYYAYNVADYSGVEYFYNEDLGEFTSNSIISKYIDIDYLTKYYWELSGGVYARYKFNTDGTYTQYNYDGSIYNEDAQYSLENNILTFYSKYGKTKMIYIDTDENNNLNHLNGRGCVFYNYSTAGQTNEYIFNTFEEVVPEIKVLLNEEKIYFDQLPININNRVMVPIRAIFEKMGFIVEWDKNNRLAIATKGNDKIEIKVDNTVIKYNINGTYGEYKCDVTPMIIADRILVPVRAVAECAGCKVSWDSDSQTVYIIFDNN